MIASNDNALADTDLGYSLGDHKVVAAAVLARHYPDGGAPAGLLLSIIRAIRAVEAESVKWAYRRHGHNGEQFAAKPASAVAAALQNSTPKGA